MTSKSTKLRACLCCTLLKTAQQFKREGCEVRLSSVSLLRSRSLRRCRTANFSMCASEFSTGTAPLSLTASRQIKGSSDRVLECTTATWDGAIAAVQPGASWVVRQSQLLHSIRV
jgi:hypothetical protein